MSSSTPRMASPRKRSRAERDDEDEEMTRAEGSGGGVPVGGEGEGLFTFPVKSTSSNSDMTLPDSSDDDDIGPAMPSVSAPKKKRRVLPYEKLYISALPSSQRYSKSLMHKEQLSFVTMTPFTDFLITSSIDGVVKFWKKVAVGIEAVKEFRAHIGEIKSVTVSQDGRSFATAGVDKTIKIFDVVTFGTCATERHIGDYELAHSPIRRSSRHITIGQHTKFNMLGPCSRCFNSPPCSIRGNWPFNQDL